MPSSSRIAASISIVLATALLAGCGGAKSGPTERFVYTTSVDCADAGKVTAEQCRAAVDKAVVEHDQKAPKYITLADCEAAEARDRCERFAERHYRPRLMGYLFTVKGPSVSASPLYAGQKGATVFRDVGGTTYDWERTEGVSFSKLAIQKAEGFLIGKRKS